MAEDFTIKTAGADAPVQATQINASVGTGIQGRAADGRVINQAVQVKAPNNALKFLYEAGKGLLEPIIQKQEQEQYLQGMARAVAGETAQDINHERPAWARAFGDSSAVEGARAYEGATDASRLEAALYTAMPDLIKKDGAEVAREAGNIASKMKSGDPLRDQTLQARIPQLLPNVLRMHATGRAKWLQDEAERVDVESKVTAIRAFGAAEAALKETPALDSTDAQVLSQNNRNLADALMSPAPGQDVPKFMQRSVTALMADVDGGNFAATYTALDHGLLGKLETSNPGLGPKLMDYLRKAETEKVHQTAFVSNPELAVTMAQLRLGNAGGPDEVRKIVKDINDKVGAAAGTRYAKFLDGNEEAALVGTSIREIEQAQRAAQAEAIREAKEDERERRRNARDDARERKQQLREQLEDGAAEGYRQHLLRIAQQDDGDQSNNRVVSDSMRTFLKESKIKEHVTDHMEAQAFELAIQGGSKSAARLLGSLPGGDVPKSFRDKVASGREAGQPDTLQALQTYASVKDNPALVARIWQNPLDAQAIRESYTRLEQGGKLAVLQPVPANVPPEIEQKVMQTREAAGKDLALLAQERQSRDTLGDLKKTFGAAEKNLAPAQSAVKKLTAETFGSDLSAVSRGKIEQMVAAQVGHLTGHEGVSAPELVKQAWTQVQDKALPLGTKLVAIPLDPNTPGTAALGLSGSKHRGSKQWDDALLATLSEKGGGAKYALEDIKEAYYIRGERGADLVLHVMSGKQMYTLRMPEFEVRKHVKD